MSVYSYCLKSEVTYKKVESTLDIPISIEKRNCIIELFSLYKNANYFNSKVVRIEKIRNIKEKSEVEIALIDFYDFLLINIILNQLDNFVSYLKKIKQYDGIKDVMEALDRYRVQMRQIGDFETLINRGTSSNALAVSVLLTDQQGNYLLTKRSKSVGIGEKLYSVTATGAVDENDYGQLDPIKNCVLRELREELNIHIKNEDLQIVSIVAGVQKLQPIAIVNGKIEGTFSELSCAMRKAEDFKHEVDKIYIGDKKTLVEILNKGKLTEAIEYHLKSAIEG